MKFVINVEYPIPDWMISDDNALRYLSQAADVDIKNLEKRFNLENMTSYIGYVEDDDANDND